MRVVHSGTQIITTFSLVDDDDDAIDGKRVEQTITKLISSEFEIALQQIVKFREDWQSGVDNAISDKSN